MRVFLIVLKVPMQLFAADAYSAVLVRLRIVDADVYRAWGKRCLYVEHRNWTLHSEMSLNGNGIHERSPSHIVVPNITPIYPNITPI